MGYLRFTGFVGFCLADPKVRDGAPRFSQRGRRPIVRDIINLNRENAADVPARANPRERTEVCFQLSLPGFSQNSRERDEPSLGGVPTSVEWSRHEASRARSIRCLEVARRRRELTFPR